MDTGPIPFSAIMRYAHEYGLKQAERDAFNRIIRNLDNKALTIRAEKRAREEEKQKRSSGSGAGTIVDSW